MKSRKVIVSALSALILVCVCALSGCSGRTVIDLADYVSVDFSGYNGGGSARVSIDAESMLPLIDEKNSPIAIAGNFTIGEIKNNGKLSNGDKINVTVKYSEQMMENAKINVQNSSLDFTVSGLKEKEKLDVFAGVEFTSSGTSPECTVSIQYNGGSPYGTLELQTESGEIITNNFESRKFANGERVTVSLTDNAIEELEAQYLIEETSCDYTVTSDSKYILAAADLTDEYRESLDKIAEDFVNEKIEEIINADDRSARFSLLSHVSGINAGSLYAGGTTRIDKLEIKNLNSAYVGANTVSGSFGTYENQKSIYYIYEAQISYYIKKAFSVKEDETGCALIVRIEDPKITPEGVMYSSLTFSSAKDFQSAYNSYITSSFEKLP